MSAYPLLQVYAQLHRSTSDFRRSVDRHLLIAFNSCCCQTQPLFHVIDGLGLPQLVLLPSVFSVVAIRGVLLQSFQIPTVQYQTLAFSGSRRWARSRQVFQFRLRSASISDCCAEEFCVAVLPKTCSFSKSCLTLGLPFLRLLNLPTLLVPKAFRYFRL